MEYKLGHFSDGRWQEHVHTPVFRDSTSRGENPRIEATLPHGDTEAFGKLVECMTEDYIVLYILHTPRGEGTAGRYQSPLLSKQDLRDLLGKFGKYLSSDARFDLWIHSPLDQATLVWDRHNLIYAYGIPGKFLEMFKTLGFEEGTPELPAPHEHYYRSEFDTDASDLLKQWNWNFSELRSHDLQ